LIVSSIGTITRKKWQQSPFALTAACKTIVAYC
jgi:hypothetical protein